MRQLLLVIILTFTGLFATAENINFMTYNLLTNKGLNFQSFRIDKHAQVIKASGADVVAIQEIAGNSNFNNLKEKSGLSGSWFDIDGNNYGIGILWKSSMGTPQITNVKVVPASGSTATESRAFIIAEFSDFCFISTHFSLDAVDRDTMTARIIRYANTAGKTVFVAGDFNAAPNFRAMLTFQSKNFIILNDLSVNTFPSDAPTSLIDMILGFRKSEADKSYSVVSRGIPTPPSGVSLTEISDHLPYNVTIDIATTIPDGLVVTSNGNDINTPGTLEWCVSQAKEGETITFNVDATELTLSMALNKSLTIDGMNQHNNQRMLLKKLQSNKFADLVGATISLKNLILDGEDTPSAIGITADANSTLNIDNCILRNNNSGGTANNGGACRIQGIANINNSLFENNTQGAGTYGGGAICIYNSATVTIANTSFIGNKAIAGGAIAALATVATGYSLNVSNCTFANNAAELAGTDKRGGAVYLKGPTATEANATFTNCTFTGNSAGNNGGAICAFASSGKKINIHLINSIFAHNMSGGNKYSDIDVWNLDSRVYFPTATNCIYGSLLGSAAEISWTNSIHPTDMAIADIFSQKEEWLLSFERPIITDTVGQKVILLSEGSSARNAGVATLASYEIPTTDQCGNTRSITPTIGAVEFNITSGIDQPIITNNIQVKIQGRQLHFTGLAGEAEMLVYGLTGNLLDKKMIHNHIAVALDHLSVDFVIVKIANQSFKVIFK